jgi:UrcA family protein
MTISITASGAGPRAKIALLVLGSFAGVMAAGAASAASPDSDVPTVRIHYSPQSLATDEGVKVLYRRIVTAAKEVCPESPIRNFTQERRVEQCRSEAIVRAVQQVDNSRLAALHAARSKNG